MTKEGPGVPMYKLRMFGGFDLREGRGEPVAVVSKKGRCLLVCLVLARGQSVPRDRLAGLLWGDRSDARARHNLSQALYRLRGLFPENIQSGFERSKDTIRLAIDLFDVDVIRFETGLNGGAQDAAEAVLALYTGDLLAGLEVGQEGFDGWLTTERERLRERAAAGWRDLMENHMNASPRGAIEAATQLLALNLVDEGAHRSLMELHARLGRRDLAVRQYEKCKYLLRTELGIEPDQETRALRERIEAEARIAPPNPASDTPQHAEEAPTGAAKPLAAERRQVTVLQCDLVISSHTSQRFDLEDRREVVQSARQACADILRRYDGFMMKPVGDGFLACFGFPQAHEDDAARAAHTGLDVVEAVQRLTLYPQVQLAARVGIATGLVIVGHASDGDFTEEQGISGEAPNLASQLQHDAPPGSVVICGSTQRLLDTGFDIVGHNPQGQVAGGAWRVTGRLLVESRFEARDTGALSAFVGREEEVDFLLRHWDKAKSGEGQAVLISGEPGIGKSRLAQVLDKRLADVPHTRLRYQCSPHHVNSALYPLTTQLEFAAGIAPSDGAADKLDKLEVLLAQATEDARSVAPLFADLLSIPHENRYPPLNLTPRAQKKRTLEVLIDQFLGLAETQPLLVIFEDLHWVDPTTQELLDLMVGRIQDASVLALLTFRPEYTAPWIGQSHVAWMVLNRLTRRESIDLVQNVVADAELDGQILNEIAEKADGIPLFVEELTRALMEGGVPEAIPPTIQASLLARFDRLGSAKEVAQLGAVIGRVFEYGLLAAVSDLDEASLHEYLRVLTNSQLVLARGVPPDSRYTFKHALVQDTAYQSLLRTSRVRQHRRVAEALERGFPELVEIEPEILAHHYAEAGSIDCAAAYLARAADRAYARSANAEAIEHARAGLALIGEIPTDEVRHEYELSLQIPLAKSFMASLGYSAAETGRAYSRAYELCEELGDNEQLYAVLFGLEGHHVIRAEFDQAKNMARRFHELAEQDGNAGLRVIGLHLMGIAPAFQGRFAESRRYMEQLVDLHTREHPPSSTATLGEDSWVMGRAFLSVDLSYLGYPACARQLASESLEESRALGHGPSHAAALWCTVWGAHVRRDVNETQNLAEEMLTVTSEQSMAQYSTVAKFYEGWTLIEQGNHADGLALLEQALSEESRPSTQEPIFFGMLAEARKKMGQYPAALDALDEAFARIEKTGERSSEAAIYCLKAAILRAQGQDGDAEINLGHALAVARNQQARLLDLRATRDLAGLWYDQGKTEDARNLLAPVYNWFTEGFDTADIKEAKALLEQLG